MAEYEAVPSFKIYRPVENATHGRDRSYSLQIALHHDFEDEGQAESWIQNEGQRQTDYIILKVFRKK